MNAKNAVLAIVLDIFFLWNWADILKSFLYNENFLQDSEITFASHLSQVCSGVGNLQFVSVLDDVNLYAQQGSSYAGRLRANPPGMLFNFHPALKIILSLNIQHSSLKSCKINKESVLKGQLSSDFHFS